MKRTLLAAKDIESLVELLTRDDEHTTAPTRVRKDGGARIVDTVLVKFICAQHSVRRRRKGEPKNGGN